MKLFIEYSKKKKLFLFSVLFLTLFSSLVSIPIPYFSRYLIDVVLIKKEYANIYIYLMFTVLIIFLQLVIGRITVKLSANFFQDFLFEIRKKIFQGSFYQEDHAESLSTIIFNDSELYVNNIQIIITTILSNIFAGIAYIIIMLKLNWKLTVITLCFIPVYVMWILYVSNRLNLLSRLQQEAKDNLLNTVSNSTMNRNVIKMYNFVDTILGSFSLVINNNRKLNVRSLVYQNYVNIVAGVIVTSASIVPFVIGVNFVANGSITIGGLVAFNSYCSLLFVPITELISLVTIVKVTQVYKIRIQEFLNTKGKTRKEIKNLFINKIIVDQLTVYSNKCILLNKVDFDIYRGEKIKLVGANGSGKSLLLKTLAQLYDNFYGNIWVANSSNDKIKLATNICMNSNKIIYVSGTQGFPLKNLYEEFTVENDISVEKIYMIINILGLSNRITLLEDGLYSNICKVLDEFSAGELQKLRLARALSRNPDFLFLDEVFSNIEKNQSLNILKSIAEHWPNLTLIIVDHHMNIDNFFDKILRIEDKNIVISNAI